jgi:hypothetical protein
VKIEKVSPKGTFSSSEIEHCRVIKGHNNDLFENASGYIRDINAGLALVAPCYFLDDLLYTKNAKDKEKN